MGRSQPSCPFPSCTSTSWPIVDNLLLHYATDHHVIEKIMFCETEAIIRELRKELATKDDIVESLLSDNAELKENVRQINFAGKSIILLDVSNSVFMSYFQGTPALWTWTDKS